MNFFVCALFFPRLVSVAEPHHLLYFESLIVRNVDLFLFDCLLCPRLVSGAGEIKLTKDGCVLLHEMVRTYLSHLP